MSTILAGKRPTEQRVQNAGSRLLAAAFERHADALLAYIRGHNELPANTDSYGAEDLAAEVWLEFATKLDRVDKRVLDFSYVRLTANKVVRRAAKVEDVEVLFGFAGGEQGLAVEGAEFGDDEDYAVAPLESVPMLAEALAISEQRARNLTSSVGTTSPSASGLSLIVDEYAGLPTQAKTALDAAAVREVLA